MPYVQRSGAGAVSGVFAQRQPGYAEEWLADGNTEVTAFLAALLAPSGASVDALGFRRLFTAAEKVAITQAGYTDPQVRVFMDDAAAALSINLADPETQQGVAYLQSKGLLTSVRATQVLAGTPTS